MALVDGVPAGSTEASKGSHHPLWFFPVCGQDVRAQLCLLPCSLPVPQDLEKPIKGFLIEISLIMVFYHSNTKVSKMPGHQARLCIRNREITRQPKSLSSN